MNIVTTENSSFLVGFGDIDNPSPQDYTKALIYYIDLENWIPLKINYFDSKGALWKVLTITWQNVSGVWFWKKGVVEYVQEDYTTYIVMDDIKVNLDLNERAFTKVGLERSFR